MKTALVAMLMLIASVASAVKNPSLATVLTPDGSLMEGASGSFDPSGFRLTYGPDGEPRFTEEEVFCREPVPNPRGQVSDGTWYPLGSGMNNVVFSIAMSGSKVYAGGNFTQAGGNPAYHIACWDDDSWNPMGTGFWGG